jgi:hypothetical protein
MLQHVDTMIGFSVVMLLLSLLITVLVQWVSAILNLRGVNLLWGVTRLFQQLVPSLTPDRVGEIAKKLLVHDSVSPGSMFFDYQKYAGAIRSDEIVQVLQALASDKMLKDDIEKILSAGQAAALPLAAATKDEIEKHFPQQADSVAAFIATLQARATSDAGKLKAWYDTIMDRTSERFVSHTRLATVAFAALLAFGLTIDSLYIFQRISGDADLRAQLVQSAKTTETFVAGYQASAKADAIPTAQLTALGKTAGEISSKLTESEFPLWPQHHVYPWDKEYPQHIPGMLITLLLLSLGAPFWYGLLQQLANLRPLLAGKVDKDEAPGAQAQ